MKSYELTDHLGNVHVVLSDLKKADNNVLKSDVMAAYEYYPFGMLMQKIESSSVYRYGFNGMEHDEEISGENSYTAEYWQYDSRLGRRWNLDPITNHNESPYACFNNNPIRIADPYGDTGDDKVQVYTGVDASNVTENSKKVLIRLVDAAGLKKVVITGTARTARRQAEVMYDKLVAGQPDNYKQAGTQVQQVYKDMVAAGETDKETIIEAMYQKVLAVGLANVSKHCADFNKYVTVDLGYNNNKMTPEQEASFVAEIEKLKKDGVIQDFQYKGNNPNEKAYHIVISVEKSNELFKSETKEKSASSQKLTKEERKALFAEFKKLLRQIAVEQENQKARR